MGAHRTAFTFLSVLIPSWRFFDDLGAHPKVYIKLANEKVWIEAFAPQPRRPWQLFFNPQGNLRLLSLSAFERLIHESQEHLSAPEAFLSTTTYRLCLRILESEIRRRALPLESFQFKICAYLSEESTLQDAFVSKVHRFGP